MNLNMDRMTFGRKTLNGQRPRVDRFVAPRESFSELRRRTVWDTRSDRHAQDIWFTRNLHQKRYMTYLDDAFGLEPLQMEKFQDKYVPHWPCVPRKKGYLSSADSILDLPTYSYAAFPELLDWSSDDILVAALGHHYHKWSWQSQNLTSEGITLFPIECCKFDPRGELLALGTKMRTVEIHDNVLSKWVTCGLCQCAVEDTDYCSITAVDWSPTGNSFISGCSNGMLVSYSRTSVRINCHHASNAAILAVRVSPNARYVAAAAVNGDAVMLFTWPSLQLYSNMISKWTVKALTWHPWRSALLGVGAVSNFHARVALWDAPSKRIKQTCLSRKEYSLDAMLFSHRTGELVLSLWNGDITYSRRACSRLLVMSDQHTIVDQWGEGQTGLDRVRTMIFSPDGTKLATATADEDLIIWNFLPEDGKKKKKYCRRFSAIPVYLDESSYGFSLR